MAKTKVTSKLDLDIKITLELTLNEAKALNAIIGCGSEPFIEFYYKDLGKSYLQPHEAGVHSLFVTIKETLPIELNKADKIINAINEALKD